ncbi:MULTISPECIES: hypothetical protein [Flammeovirga]|uniref:Uncharacterized protein n=1 Tax=Flammeovirga agarivorans TaxID=2726742 RepID=A0A7X8SGM3_9BACT|nr:MULTISPECIES: hypothetical protein [Flammeovirga]NLR89742.1 hypothetical protein [Flammeovirga agarivorans]
MKKYLFILLAVMVSITSFAQDKKKSKVQVKAEKYAEVFAKEFSLNEEQQKSVYEIKLQQIKDYGNNNKAKKNGDVTAEAFKEKRKEIGKTATKKISEATGVTSKEINAFNKKLKEQNKAKQ